MAGNTTPIFSRVGDIQWGDLTSPLKTANTTRDLTSGTMALVFTSDATNGGRVERVRFQPLGSNVATAGRLWINNGLTTTSAANNTLLEEVTLASTTSSEVAKLTASDISVQLALPPGYRLYATIGTTVSAGFAITASGGKY